MRLIVLRVDAGHDKNGNPRRANILFDDDDGSAVGVVIEGYYGSGALKEAAVAIAVGLGVRAASIKFLELGTIDVSAGLYRDLKRGSVAPVLFHG